MWSAVEIHEFAQAAAFLERLLDSGAPTVNDLANIVKYCIRTGDDSRLVEAMEKMQLSDSFTDILSRNRSLALCTSSGATDLAEKIASVARGAPMDVVAHNTLMKGFAKQGDTARCFKQYGEMRQSQIRPSEVTFGILLDACVDARLLSEARGVFADLRESGLAMNSVLYTTFIKGLVGAGEVAEAAELFDEMCSSEVARPDRITFSTLARAHASKGSVQECNRLLDRMIKMRIQPDSVFFNTVFSACTVNEIDPAQVLHMLAWLVKKGLQPSCATLSVAIKALALSKSWGHALDLLASAPRKYGVWPDVRTYCQLAQACAGAGCGDSALAAYAAMVSALGQQDIKVDRTHTDRMQGLCESAGRGDGAARIAQALMDSDGRVGQRVLGVLREYA